MSLLKRLFGGKADQPGAVMQEAAAEDYKGYRIIPGPIREGNQYRVAARIEKTVGAETKVHNLIRADTMGSLEDATAASLNKARQIIDEQGDRIFG